MVKIPVIFISFESFDIHIIDDIMNNIPEAQHDMRNDVAMVASSDTPRSQMTLSLKFQVGSKMIPMITSTLITSTAKIPQIAYILVSSVLNPIYKCDTNVV